jgi:hypothetical protein
MGRSVESKKLSFIASLIDWLLQRFNYNATVFNYSTIFNRALAVVNWLALTLVLVGDVLLLMLVKDNNTTSA